MSIDKIAQQLVAPGKGILAADESTPTIGKRFDSIGAESTEENRRQYRQMLFTAPNMEDYISGVIMYDETLRQNCDDGTTFAKYLTDKGVTPGIKVDAGAKALPGFNGEKVTEGLDGLRDRLKEYYDLGARFAKWRGVIDIDSDHLPSRGCVEANAHALARYAGLCQEAGLVPIVEPEVLMDGSHDIKRCEVITGRVLKVVFKELSTQRVSLEGMLLKPNMVISGMKCPQQASVEEVAAATLRCFRRYVPAAVPGIVFLSGGQSAEHATAHLNAMNAMGEAPWQLSFSYGRALQAPALAAWGGKAANLGKGAKAFADRAKLNGAARSGQYQMKMEQAA